MDHKMQNLAVGMAVPPCLLAAILLMQCGDERIFGLEANFLSGVFVGFAIIFSTVIISKIFAKNSP